MSLAGVHILSIDQFELSDVQRILSVASEMEPYAQRRRVTRVLEGAVLGNLFFEPSTRSRVSFGAAFNRLGGSVRDTTGFQFSSMAKGESLYDTARVISGYADVIVMRHPDEGSLATFAEGSLVPVISGGDGPGEHPTQALLDLYTIQKELRRGVEDIRGLHVAMVGDLAFGRTVHSLVKLLSMFDQMTFYFVAPPELQMPEALIEMAKASGHKVIKTMDLADGISDVDVVYTTRLQQERFTYEADVERYRGSYAINRALYEKHCRPETILLHPLPRDSRPGARELDDDLNEIPTLAIFRQTDNGIPVRMALFALVLGAENKVHESAYDAIWLRPQDHPNNS